MVEQETPLEVREAAFADAVKRIIAIFSKTSGDIEALKIYLDQPSTEAERSELFQQLTRPEIRELWERLERLVAQNKKENIDTLADSERLKSFVKDTEAEVRRITDAARALREAALQNGHEGAAHFLAFVTNKASGIFVALENFDLDFYDVPELLDYLQKDLMTP